MRPCAARAEARPTRSPPHETAAADAPPPRPVRAAPLATEAASGLVRVEFERQRYERELLQLEMRARAARAGRDAARDAGAMLLDVLDDAWPDDAADDARAPRGGR